MKRQPQYYSLKNVPHVVYLSAVLLTFSQIEPALGSIDTWTFDGTVTQGLAGSPYQANLPYSVYFYVDTTRISTVASGLYYPIVGYGFTENGAGFGASSTGSAVLIANDRPLSGGGSFDGIVFSMFGEGATSFPFDGSAFGVTLVNDSTGPTATPFTGTSFPTTLDLNQFSRRDMTVYFQSGAVEGSVDSLYINGVLVSQVPEPGFISLFVSGIVVLTCRLVRRKPKCRNGDA